MSNKNRRQPIEQNSPAEKDETQNVFRAYQSGQLNRREPVQVEDIPTKKNHIFVVTAVSLNVRVAPQGQILFTIPKGTKVIVDAQIVNDNNEWASVRLCDNETKVGYVMSSFLNEETEL